MSGNVAVDSLPGFAEALTAEARAMVENPRQDLLYTIDTPDANGDIVRRVTFPQFFSKIVQHPVKEWYGRKMAVVLNRLVAAGFIDSVFAIGSIPLTVGSSVIPGLIQGAGPDAYTAVFMFLHTPKSMEELNRFVGDDCFVLEGHIGRVDGPWLNLCLWERTDV